MRRSQPAGSCSSSTLGSASGLAPDAVEPVDPRARDDAVAERLALLVLAQLEVHAEQLVQQLQQPGAVVAAAAERRAQAGQVVEDGRRRRRP